MGRQDQELGKRLRQLRHEKGWTLEEMGRRIGRSRSYLSRVENGNIGLTLSSLKEIADALGRPIIHLLDEDESHFGGKIAKGDHRKLVVSSELEYDILSTPNTSLSLFRMRLRGGGNSGKKRYSHEGLESGILLQGSLVVKVGDQVYHIQEGDSLTYLSQEWHWFENPGEEDAIAIWVVTPPTF